MAVTSTDCTYIAIDGINNIDRDDIGDIMLDDISYISVL